MGEAAAVGSGVSGFAGVPSGVPRPVAELGPLLDWLRPGRPTRE
ncbi:hypothetical protein R6V09_35445 [Streptomyces sp. W16]|nr:hypothetical protein [Streptomyces sp. W16]MDV9175394.1 hypothetical protein [Streptomyces sp. W16]